jgi:hypothetical protein
VPGRFGKQFTTNENNVNNDGMKEMVGVRLENELKKLLQDMADKEHRPLSNYIRFIILDWLRAHKGIDWPPKKRVRK